MQPLIIQQLLDGVALVGRFVSKDIQVPSAPAEREVNDLVTVGLHHIQVLVKVITHKDSGGLYEVCTLLGPPGVLLQP